MLTVSEFKPHHQLASFIDTYWEVTSKEGGISIDRVLPDGCVDVIVNLGEDIQMDRTMLKSEKAYLGGAITHFIKAEIKAEVHLVGVRFKPSAFSCFHAFSSLHETTNKFVELSKSFTPSINGLFSNISFAFDSFYHNRLIQPDHLLLPVVETVKNYRGNISVNKLADKHFTTVRQLERHFRYHIGLSPKELLNIFRYKFAQHLILTSHPKKSLSDIAFECGYYDQAHLGNEIKRYTGLAPTNL